MRDAIPQTPHRPPRVGVSIQLPLSMRDQIDSIARERRTTRTAVIEQILTAWLADNEEPSKE